MPPSTRRLLVAFLAVALVGGAIVLKVYPAVIPGVSLQIVMATETFHVVAHLLLYGALASLVRPLVRRARAAVAATMAVALVQEAAQSVLFGRAPGWPELFDLGVDLVAVAVALEIYRRVRPERGSAVRGEGRPT